LNTLNNLKFTQGTPPYGIDQSVDGDNYCTDSVTFSV
jgi:hypothetical protein